MLLTHVPRRSQLLDVYMPKLHLFDLLWICCTTSFTTNPRQIHNKSNKWSLGNTKHGHVPIRTYPFMNITNNFSEFQ